MNNKFDTQYLEIEYIKSKYPKTYFVLRALPGIVSLSILILTLTGYWIFIWNEYTNYKVYLLVIAFLILFYYIWWIIRGFEYSIFLFMSVFQLSRYKNIDFNKIFSSTSNLNTQEKIFKSKLKQDLKYEDVIHWFMIPTYKESKEILDETISALLNSQYDIRKFAVTLNGEQGDEQHFRQISQELKEKYKDKFGYFDITIHPKGVEGEISGKGANIKYAAKDQYQKILAKFKTTPDKVLVTTLDADTNIDPKYPNILSYTYISTDNRKYKSYQPMIFFFNNFWDAPFFSKLVSLGNSFWVLFNSLKKFGLRNFSTHAQPLDALIETDFWSSQTVVEDGHQYRRSYFKFGDIYECVPIYSKVYQDSNLSNSFISTAKAQYNQIRRWAHGAEDLPYIICQWIYGAKKVSFSRTLYEVLRHFEGLITWSTLHIMLMFGFTFTMIKDIKLSSYISLGGAISLFINISFITLILLLGMQMFFSPWHKLNKIQDRIMMVFRFLFVYTWLLGPCLFIFAGTPALHTQIALMMGKPMKKFNVTKKVRK